MDWVTRFLGLRGSWKWACRQLDKGHTVRRSTDTGACKYRLDPEGQRRIEWAFSRKPDRDSDWESACVFLADFESVDWEIDKEVTRYA